MANAKKVSTPAYDAFVGELMGRVPDLETGSLFGMPCVKARSKAVLGAFDGGVAFKLDANSAQAALDLAGSVLFDPSGKGRPMKGWVVVTAAHRDLWPHFADRSLAALGS